MKTIDTKKERILILEPLGTLINSESYLEACLLNRNLEELNVRENALWFLGKRECILLAHLLKNTNISLYFTNSIKEPTHKIQMFLQNSFVPPERFLGCIEEDLIKQFEGRNWRIVRPGHRLSKVFDQEIPVGYYFDIGVINKITESFLLPPIEFPRLVQ